GGKWERRIHLYGIALTSDLSQLRGRVDHGLNETVCEAWAVSFQQIDSLFRQSRKGVFSVPICRHLLRESFCLAKLVPDFEVLSRWLSKISQRDEGIRHTRAARILDDTRDASVVYFIRSLLCRLRI